MDTQNSGAALGGEVSDLFVFADSFGQELGEPILRFVLAWRPHASKALSLLVYEFLILGCCRDGAVEEIFVLSMSTGWVD